MRFDFETLEEAAELEVYDEPETAAEMIAAAHALEEQGDLAGACAWYRSALAAAGPDARMVPLHLADAALPDLLRSGDVVDVLAGPESTFVSGSTFADNSTTGGGFGGAIQTKNLTLSNSTFINNSGAIGAVSVQNGTATITNCTFNGAGQDLQLSCWIVAHDPATE